MFSPYVANVQTISGTCIVRLSKGIPPPRMDLLRANDADDHDAKEFQLTTPLVRARADACMRRVPTRASRA